LAGLSTGQAWGQNYEEQGRKIIYLRETGSGIESKYAAIKLDNPNTLEAGCFEDILILDASTPEGKAKYQELESLQAAGTALSSITYTRDEEGDCHLLEYKK
jgi:hypothetical protein